MSSKTLRELAEAVIAVDDWHDDKGFAASDALKMAIGITPGLGDTEACSRATAHCIIAALDAERKAGHVDVLARMSVLADNAIALYYSDRSTYNDGYSDGLDTASCALRQEFFWGRTLPEPTK